MDVLFYMQFTGYLPAARMAFSTAMTMTPTSAKMAAHILAMPHGTQYQTQALDTQRKHDVLVHDRSTCGRCGWPWRSSGVVVHQHHVRRLNGASEPMAPMRCRYRNGTAPGIVDAVAHEGQLAVGVAQQRSTCATLSAGSSSLCTSSTHSSPATWSATRRISPVSMTVFSTPPASGRQWPPWRGASPRRR